MAKKIYTNAERKQQFIKAGIKLAKRDGIDRLTISGVATECKVTPPLIFHVFGTRDKFRKAVQAAAKKANVSVAGKVKPVSKTPRKAMAKTPAVAKPPRKRSVKEVKAIKEKAAAAGSTFATMPAPSNET